MLILRGFTALADFRLQQLLDQIHTVQPSVKQLNAHYVYFVDLEQRLSQSQETVLCDILHAALGKPSVQGHLNLVLPRAGTISPWSSKATDILHHCGLTEVSRVERGIAYDIIAESTNRYSEDELDRLAPLLHDRMTEDVIFQWEDASGVFVDEPPKPLKTVDIIGMGGDALEMANRELGLALSDEEINYLVESFQQINRNPTDVELMMFAQVNSEHCRHKVFNASWIIDGQRKAHSLFEMIKNTHQANPEYTLSAYRDNAAVIEGFESERFFIDPDTRRYVFDREFIHILMKVETHNHPTAIAPFPGAATGSGGEIRDEAATGCGAKPKAGLTGFSVSPLQIPGGEKPWEWGLGKPGRIASPLDIMIHGPVGAASFNNEFGRPGILGYFRTFGLTLPGDEHRGYHKPIMLAGGLGNIREEHIKKRTLPENAQIFVLGGPAMLIGLGGGAASSMSSGASAEDLDFASVQRSNPEMQRRCQEVIDRCWELGEDNPVLSVHDVGAGGLSNAVPEIIHDSERGGRFQLRAIPNDDPGMSPMQIWCNESQERFVVAVASQAVSRFTAICERERCPYALIGEATGEEQLIVGDGYFDNTPVNISNALILGKPPKMLREVKHRPAPQMPFDYAPIPFREALERVISMPAVADKRFLITIGDRTVTGLVCRDQMVGPWQVAVADAAVTALSLDSFQGEAMSMGERAPLALLDAAASARMAVGEAITNIACARVSQLANIRLSANWMVAAGHEGEDAGLYDAVEAIGMDLCPKLGISIPVGKDSMSMKTVWQENELAHQVTAPLSVIISAFSRVDDCRGTLTPQLRTDVGPSKLLFIDLGAGRQRLGSSVLAQVYQTLGTEPPDVESPETLKAFFTLIQELNEADRVLAYHDRSDGGLITCLCEMAFAGHCGLDVQLGPLGDDFLGAAFNEELGAVLQVSEQHVDAVQGRLAHYGLSDISHWIGTPEQGDGIVVHHGDRTLYEGSRQSLHRLWSETSWRIQRLRDNPACADEEYERLQDNDDPGLTPVMTFDPSEAVNAPYVTKGLNPPLAVLREQGVNGQTEMAAAFDGVGFACTDVHMSDIIDGRTTLRDFVGLVACGGFSYGDVLGAGGGWAKSILYNNRARDEFEAFFNRTDSFALGVCNGCQMLSQLKSIIPGTEHWPVFVKNTSQQFEARLALVEVLPSPSILLDGMAGSYLPVPVAHGEGRAEFEQQSMVQDVLAKQLAVLRYVDNRHQPTEHYPENPNGSSMGITGLTTGDGRFTIMMPHPERAFRTVQLSWHPPQWAEPGPWMRLFHNARRWVD